MESWDMKSPTPWQCNHKHILVCTRIRRRARALAYLGRYW